MKVYPSQFKDEQHFKLCYGTIRGILVLFHWSVVSKRFAPRSKVVHVGGQNEQFLSNQKRKTNVIVNYLSTTINLTNNILDETNISITFTFMFKVIYLFSTVLLDFVGL